MTSSADVSWETPPTKTFLVLEVAWAFPLFLGVACLGSIFLPSKVCAATARTRSTEPASANVMNPNPRLLCVEQNQLDYIQLDSIQLDSIAKPLKWIADGIRCH